ncbi:hypothetical protein [Nocardia neocaledoniensis]|uniref:hypothetical protein n=1 Tax=Nocardia neocaledoniensis TaxID=236511 RepID=UPI002458394C|nr:hypothetical protein [Nocardia neocaledoniensis]
MSHSETEAAHRVLRERPEYIDRLQIASAHERAAFRINAVGMLLGHWAARGDWAAATEESRTRSGADALAALDAELAAMTEIRNRLAAAVATDPAGAAEGQAGA